MCKILEITVSFLKENIKLYLTNFLKKDALSPYG